MNPILRSYFSQLDEVVADLGDALADQNQRMATLREARQRALQESWSKARKLSALSEDREAFERLQTENSKLKQRQEALRERLREVLRQTKALTEGLRV